MNWFEKFLYYLQQLQMETPVSYGWFHIMCLLILVIILFILLKIKKNTEKELKIVLGAYGIIAFILELLKQIMWSFNYDSVTGVVSWDYTWYAAPFQLCTTPIYVCLICLFLKKCKIRDALLSYIAYVTILGSISTILIPDSCFVSDVLINVHTMWLHLGSFVVSIYLLASGHVKTNIKNLLNACIAFIMFVSIALGLNISIYNSGILNGETFNMFYISPYFISSLPVFDLIQENVPYILFLIIYVVLLMLGATVILGISKLVLFLHRRIVK